MHVPKKHIWVDEIPTWPYLPHGLDRVSDGSLRSDSERRERGDKSASEHFGPCGKGGAMQARLRRGRGERLQQGPAGANATGEGGGRVDGRQRAGGCRAAGADGKA